MIAHCRLDDEFPVRMTLLHGYSQSTATSVLSPRFDKRSFFVTNRDKPSHWRAGKTFGRRSEAAPGFNSRGVSIPTPYLNSRKGFANRYRRGSKVLLDSARLSLTQSENYFQSESVGRSAKGPGIVSIPILPVRLSLDSAEIR